MHIKHHTKSDGRSLWLYSQEPRDYEFTNDLPPLDNPATPYKRWHPLRQEYVFYNAARNNRTLNPPPEYNPLAPVAKDGFPGEIPVTDFEIAVFDNRWPGLSLKNTIPEGLVDEALPSTGKCEVIVYSTNDSGSLADFSVDHIVMLMDVWATRYAELITRDDISYVMPFENRGTGIGVTLPHPHGQLYAFEQTPSIVDRQCQANAKSRLLQEIAASPKPELLVEENESASVSCPLFARYPYETWLMPKQSVASPKEMTEEAKRDFAKLLKKHVARQDALFREPLDYVMWVSLPPKGFEESWPFHIQFWPMKRGPGKMKYLASVEQITQLFLVDVIAEEAAKELRAVKL